MLVHPFSALLSSTHAWDLVGVVLKVELVVVAQLLAPHDPTVGEDYDVVVSVCESGLVTNSIFFCYLHGKNH